MGFVSGGAVNGGLSAADVVAAGRVLVVRAGAGFLLQAVDASGRAVGAPARVSDLASEVARLESGGAPGAGSTSLGSTGSHAAGSGTASSRMASSAAASSGAAGPRWVWWRTAEVHPLLLEAGVRVARCHDLSAVENLLHTYEGEPFVPPQSAGREAAAAAAAASRRGTQISLFGEGEAGGGTRMRGGTFSGRGRDAAESSGKTAGPDNAGDLNGMSGSDEGDGPDEVGGGWVPTDAGVSLGSGGAVSGTVGEATTSGAVGGATGSGTISGATVGEATGSGTIGEATVSGAVVQQADTRTEPPQDLPGLLGLYAAQLAHVERVRSARPGFPLLVAAESAAHLAAVEMGRAGLPWNTRIHDDVLTDLLGPRPQHHGRPRKLQTLAEEVSRELVPNSTGPGLAVNPDSPVEVLKALKRQGVMAKSTRAGELKEIDHPAIKPLLRYKELSRLHVAHGWSWQDEWVRQGRFHAEYVPGGVVTGRWATDGGGALQIPKVMRACVVADPGWVLVAADAGQLEPRILAALSGDRGMIAATADPDLYTALARQALGRPDARDEAKIGLLSAMYGARANSPAMVALRRRFPQALDLLERAARTGENGGVVRSVLGRTCPPPEPTWQDVPMEQALARSRARGRFTRNFVIQASAADWANALVAGLRRRLSVLPQSGGRAELVFFQHDEVIVHAPAALAGEAVTAIVESGTEATSLVLGDRGVRIPLAAAPIASYAEKN
ncbi:bifunctional 3'-5' exonuclease/DNA polymerase [Kineosporia succinea]|uniref:DNA-directed DNA polymerase n=1 Tax=Kineosporia succinea TaxID=84632 RepID=A0ABT9NZT5_9ACTN|nr:bifunctional 3'-5' exonuclease/DNA polymerase [Kineosporia succinea]MDP9825940.1 hypothetical protein [Kineosporia succinea]